MSQFRLYSSLAVLFCLLISISLVIAFPQIRPVSTSAATVKYNVLFDNGHAETAGNADWVISSSQPDPLSQNANPQVETDWTGGISAWGVALQKTGRYSLKTTTSALTYGSTSNTLDLTHFNALVLPEPNVLFTTSEKTAIVSFVRNGGGLFMIADHTGSDRNNDGNDSLHVLNDLMNNNGSGSDIFGIQFDVLDISSENPSNDTPNADPVLNGPFGIAHGSIIRDGTTETLNKTDNPNAHGIIYRSSFSNTGATGAFVSGSLYGQGRVLAEGDSSAIDDGTCAASNTCFDGWDDPAGQDAILFPNGTEWLAAGTLPGTPTTTPTPTATVHASPTPTSPASTNRITNGGFEQGSSPWIESSSGGFEIVDTTRVHTGSFAAFLCGYNNCQDSIFQTVTLPATTTSATLSYFWFVTTTETTHSFDFLSVEVRNSSGTVLSTLQTLSDASTAGSWQQASFSLSSFAGQTIEVAFVGTNGTKNPTDFFIDDVSLLTN